MTEDLTAEDRDLLARMRVTYPERKAGRLMLRRFTIDENDTAGHAYYGSRMTSPGEYTKLQEIIPGHKHGGIVWMSDTDAELVDHLPTARRIADPSCKRVLINGLGLGCIAKLAASFDHVEQIYVVDRDPRVIKLVGRWFKTHYGSRVEIIHADAYEVDWSRDTHFDVVWHDIWPNIDEDNLPGMRRLHEKYKDHCTWQDSWAVDLCMMMQDVSRELFDRYKKKYGDMPAEDHELRQSYEEFVELEQDYAWFVEQGYHAAPREGHNTPLDKLEELERAGVTGDQIPLDWDGSTDGTIWRVMP